MTELTDREIAQSHTIDDLCTEVGTMRRAILDNLFLLEDGLHALRAGRYEVTEEYLDRILDRMIEALTNATRKEQADGQRGKDEGPLAGAVQHRGRVGIR